MSYLRGGQGDWKLCGRILHAGYPFGDWYARLDCNDLAWDVTVDYSGVGDIHLERCWSRMVGITLPDGKKDIVRVELIPSGIQLRRTGKEAGRPLVFSPQTFSLVVIHTTIHMAIWSWSWSSGLANIVLGQVLPILWGLHMASFGVILPRSFS